MPSSERQVILTSVRIIINRSAFAAIRNPIRRFISS